MMQEIAKNEREEEMDILQGKEEIEKDLFLLDQKTNRSAPALIDINLVLELQQKLKDVEKEKNGLIRMIEHLEWQKPEENSKTQNTVKIQELEKENAQLKKDMDLLKKSVTSSALSGAIQNLMGQFHMLREELERRKAELKQLHNVMADNMRNMKSSGSDYDMNIINEYEELKLAFETQRSIIRQLKDEIQMKEKSWRTQRELYQAEVAGLKEEIEQQQELLSLNLSKSPQTQTETYMQHENTALSSENSELQENYDKIAEKCRKFERQCQILAKHLRDAGLSYDVEFTTDSTIMSSAAHSAENGSNLLAVQKKERDYEGMFEFRKEDVNVIINRLICDLKPRTAVTLLPGLPAYILFMCIRHTDCINDDEKFRLLLAGYLNAVKRMVKKCEDFDSRILWLSNTLRLMHSIKQYSGDKPFRNENTPRQNEQCLKNFNLHECGVILSKVALWMFNNIMTNLKERIRALTVPALLEHGAITGLSSIKPGRPRSSSMEKESESTQQKLNKLLNELTSIYKTLQYYGVDDEIIVQVFKQLFYFMCASALNNLLQRNELCDWPKGIQIRYNLSHLEQWARDRRLESASAALQPIIQATQLLKARKTDDDVDAVCEMCNKLSATQIIQILNFYAFADNLETGVSVSFIEKVQKKLIKRGENNEQLVMDPMYSYPVRFPFNPSSIRLEDIEIPEVLHLPMLKKV